MLQVRVSDAFAQLFGARCSHAHTAPRILAACPCRGVQVTVERPLICRGVQVTVERPLSLAIESELTQVYGCTWSTAEPKKEENLGSTHV